MKVGDDVRTLSFDELKRELTSGELGPSTLLCRVGDSEWRTLASAHAAGVISVPELDSITLVQDSELVMEVEPRAFDQRLPLFKRWMARAPRVKNKGRLAAWAIAGLIGLAVILQRNGALHATASFAGQGERYEALERDLIGGPASGTVRSVQDLWRAKVPEGTVPFSEVVSREKAKGARDTAAEKVSD